MSNAFVQQLEQRISKLDDLKSAPFIFVWHDAVRKPLCSPYDGPYKELQRMDKYNAIQNADKTNTISMYRLNPAYLECIPPPVFPSHSSALSPPIPPVSDPSTQPSHSTTPSTHFATPFSPQRIFSRSGKHINFPVSFKDFVV
ncbi:unnamed protein product [Schistocephalus solidus]|uniref:Ras-GEF domain-containing protein n=1 Tax=Schistocephalus solidus TaxID=70667 RepID=A0A183TT70_SCHSO|nr:unnamed protein product [Schistocephalus solidus]